MKHKFNVHSLSHKGYRKTAFWSIAAAIIVVMIASALGRAAHNFQAALTDKPDVAIYLLLPEEGLGKTTLIKSTDTEREYLAETKNGPELVRLKRGEKQWYVEYKEKLHE